MFLLYSQCSALHKLLNSGMRHYATFFWEKSVQRFLKRGSRCHNLSNNFLLRKKNSSILGLDRRSFTPPTESHLRQGVDEWLSGWDFAQTARRAEEKGTTSVRAWGCTNTAFQKILRCATSICLLITLGGCDQIYRLLQKEGAEEKDLLGEVIPFESNKKVLELQKLLKLYGYTPGAVDGKFGANTRNAIERFQKDNNLTVHRFVDRKTWQLLNIFSASGLVFQGDINLSQVQTALQNSGFDPGKIDGRMGAKTLNALKEFQKAHSLVPDGKMGFKTLSQLQKYLEDPSEE